MKCPICKNEISYDDDNNSEDYELVNEYAVLKNHLKEHGIKEKIDVAYRQGILLGLKEEDVDKWIEEEREDENSETCPVCDYIGKGCPKMILESDFYDHLDTAHSMADKLEYLYFYDLLTNVDEEFLDDNLAFCAYDD